MENHTKKEIIRNLVARHLEPFLSDKLVSDISQQVARELVPIIDEITKPDTQTPVAS